MTVGIGAARAISRAARGPTKTTGRGFGEELKSPFDPIIQELEERFRRPESP